MNFALLRPSENAVINNYIVLGSNVGISYQNATRLLQTLKTSEHLPFRNRAFEMISNNLDQLAPSALGPHHSRLLEVIRAMEEELNTRLKIYSDPLSVSPGKIRDGPLTIISHILRSRRFHVSMRSLELDSKSYSSRTVLFFATNGVGLGHLTRLYAIARKMRVIDQDLNIVFVSTVPIVDQFTRDGIPFHHFPSKASITTGSTNVWNIFLKDHLSLLLQVYNPSVLVFDGVYPYHGLLGAIKNRKDLQKIWVRRPSLKASDLPVRKLAVFDELIIPEDSFTGPTFSVSEKMRTTRCKPIVCIDKEELLPRDEVRARLNMPKEAVAVLVQLGAGIVVDNSQQLAKIIQMLEEQPQVHIVNGQSILSQATDLNGPRLQTIRDYPLPVYYRGFDLAIIAGGYNSYHEAIHLGLPAICLPNPSTQSDDQVKRVQKAGEDEAMLVINIDDEASLTKAIETMLDPDSREKISQATRKLRQENGANHMAEHIIRMLKPI